MANEFESVSSDVGDDFGNDTDVDSSEDDLIASGSAGKAYDWTTAPDRAKTAPRISLDGKTVVITKAEIIIPPMDTQWEKSRDKTKDLKMCQFILYYSEQGQSEYYSGIRVFRRDNKYSHPTITRDGLSQASALLKTYADFKKKNINEVSMREFMGFLNSQPKAVIKAIDFKNPKTLLYIKKNIAERFV